MENQLKLDTLLDETEKKQLQQVLQNEFERFIKLPIEQKTAMESGIGAEDYGNDESDS